MLTRRENLLITPWQRRRYLDHRRKVQSALPAIDVKSPAYRDHVTLKRKKIQREYERCKKIEHDNFILLKHLDKIMTTCRVDNTWETPPPEQKSPDLSVTELPESPKTRKEKCVGCTPKYFQTELQIIVPQERIPYDPPKRRLSRRRSSVLAQEEMKKEIDRLTALDLYRKKQNLEHYQFQRSRSSSSQRTNSAEIQQSPRKPNTSSNPTLKLPDSTKHRRTKTSNALISRAQSTTNLSPYASTLPPATNQNARRTGQVSDLKLSTVQTFPNDAKTRSGKRTNITGAVRTNSSSGVSRSNLSGAVSRTRPGEVKRSTKMKQIELKKDALELVLIFPAQSKVMKSTRKGYENEDMCPCPKI